MSEQGKRMICAWEGLRLAVYLDQVGYPTAGWGHKLRGAEVAQHPVGSPISREQADQWLAEDMAEAETAIRHHVQVELNDNQIAALECLVFNGGTGLLTGRAPKLMAALNRGDFVEAADEFLDICNTTDAQTGERRRNEGLANRRRAERALFLTPAVPEAPLIDPDQVAALVGLTVDQLLAERWGNWRDRAES